MVDWDRYRGGFGGGWAVSWFVNAMQGHCNVNPIFCLLGDFVLFTNLFFRICRIGRQHDKKEEVIEMALHAACPFRLVKLNQ